MPFHKRIIPRLAGHFVLYIKVVRNIISNGYVKCWLTNISDGYSKNTLFQLYCMVCYLFFNSGIKEGETSYTFNVFLYFPIQRRQMSSKRRFSIFIPSITVVKITQISIVGCNGMLHILCCPTTALTFPIALFKNLQNSLIFRCH